MFIDQAKDWMKDFGYSLHARSGDGTWASFTSNDPGDYRPVVECFINEVKEWRVKLTGGNLKMLLSIKSPDLPFGNKDMEKFINVAAHYAKVCEQNQPW